MNFFRQKHHQKTESNQNLCYLSLVRNLVILLLCASFISCGSHFKIIKRNFTSDALDGNFLDDPSTRIVRVVVPPGYKPPEEATEDYPTIYLLHGFTATDAILDQIAEQARSQCDLLFKSGQIGKMIIVIPNAETSLNGDFETDPTGSWYTDSPETGNYKQYITPDLVNFIDEEFSTLEDKNKRGITGFSMGGYGSIFLSLQQPGNSLFSSVASHSGVLSLEDFLPMLADPPEWDIIDWFPTKVIPSMDAAFSPGLQLNPRIEDGEIKYCDEAWTQWLEHDPLTYLEDNPESFTSFKVYLDCGKYDELGLAQHTEKFAEKLNELGVVCDKYIYEYETGIEWLDIWSSGHLLIYWRLAESLKFHWQHFSME